MFWKRAVWDAVNPAKSTLLRVVLSFGFMVQVPSGILLKVYPGIFTFPWEVNLFHTFPGIQLNCFKHRVSTCHGVAVAPNDVQRQQNGLFFAVPGPRTDCYVNLLRWGALQNCSRIREYDWGWWKVSLQVGTGAAGPSGRWETPGNNGQYLQTLDIGKDCDSFELWTARFFFAFSNIINSSSTFQKILSVHTAKDGA